MRDEKETDNNGFLSKSGGQNSFRSGIFSSMSNKSDPAQVDDSSNSDSDWDAKDNNKMN